MESGAVKPVAAAFLPLKGNEECRMKRKQGKQCLVLHMKKWKIPRRKHHSIHVTRRQGYSCWMALLGLYGSAVYTTNIGEVVLKCTCKLYYPCSYGNFDSCSICMGSLPDSLANFRNDVRRTSIPMLVSLAEQNKSKSTVDAYRCHPTPYIQT